MWKDYVSGSIKNNRSSSLTVRLSAFIAALLLSLLCGLFYNAWKYEVERIILEQGGWHSRITGAFNEEQIEHIKNFGSIKNAQIKQAKGKQADEATVELYFEDLQAVFADTPRIAALSGCPMEKVSYHYELLAMYLIRSANDTAPRMLLPLFLIITALACFSLVAMIHNAFAVSMNARIHQFGIFSSIGAAPKQLMTCLLQEAAVLCAIPLLAGNVIGIAGSMGLIQLTNVLLGSDIPGRHQAVPGYHPLVLLAALLATVITIWISAWLPARKLSRLTPLEAIKNTGELHLKHRNNPHLLTFFFGVEGELAHNALKAQKKALRTASLSLSASFLAFTVMMCFFTLSGISTRETYFEKYQDVWDIMVTVKGTEVDTFEKTAAIQELAGVSRAVVYQKAAARCIIAEEKLTEEMKSFGGFSHASASSAEKTDDGWLVHAPIIILDDNSFLAYCSQIGIAPRLDGAVVLNQIRDVTNKDFRHPVMVPYIKVQSGGENTKSILIPSEHKNVTAEIPVLSYTDKVPALREEYATIDYYELVHFLPASFWKQIKGQFGSRQEEMYICVLAGENNTLEELNELQNRIVSLIGENDVTESENRIQEYETNHTQIQGMMAIFGAFCLLLAVIGLGNVFSNTLGFVRQRKREFARYLSVGMTPEELKKMFCIEALVIAGRPVLCTVPLAGAAVWYMLRVSYLEVGEFLAEAPILGIGSFMAGVLGFVAVAYGVGWRGVRGINLAEVLKDDTMM